MKDDFKEYILDQFSLWHDIEVKRMFGGWGLYKEGVFFGLISDDQLYFKVDDGNREDYQKHDSYPFSYIREGKEVKLSYWLVPSEILEDREELYAWAEKSIEINDS